jgi:hypothetical protein
MSADCHKENGHTADYNKQWPKFESGLPQAWMDRIYSLLPESGAWQAAVHMRSVCHGFIPVVANRDTGARKVASG